MTMTNLVKFQVYRFNPDVDKKPYMQDYSIELAEEDNMLLDGLMRLNHAGKAFAAVTA
jgi:succinate dehydrogenase / fumarate reductase, iron-sulfur subunit